ncbi:GtrA family protein [Streptomyces sp. NRRL B-1347]|uniref:GtrA family protein n=1 Tax=Streptomyces sp. NRRL B-1347 TaxID=1476877 RepID=UPI0004C83ECF|nr:GtrA family protein [Streptomyces sp. NRRL B-1347]
MTSTVHEAARLAGAPHEAAAAAPGQRLARPRRVPPRLRRLCVELVKFGVVGGSGVAVNFLVFNLLLHGLGSAPMAATVLASAVAMGTNYLGFRFFAYRDRARRTRRQIVLFFAFSGIGVAMETLLFYAAYHGAGMNGPLGANVAKAQSILLASAFRFLVYRTWVFQHRGHTRGA